MDRRMKRTGSVDRYCGHDLPFDSSRHDQGSGAQRRELQQSLQCASPALFSRFRHGTRGCCATTCVKEATKGDRIGVTGWEVVTGGG